MSIKISVIIPIYNSEAYLRECLDSVINQTLKEIEIICVDAGSDDNSVEIISEYANRDPRMMLVLENIRLDAGSARNLGMSKATGEYLIFLDSDDYFESTMLEETYNSIKSNDADILIFQAQQLDMRTSTITDMPWSLRAENCPAKRCFSPDEMSEKIFNSFQNWTWNKLFKKEFIMNNNIHFQAIQRTNDMAFVCEALVAATKITTLPKTFTTYRIGSGTSLQQTNDLSPVCFWEAYKETKKRLIALGKYEQYKRSFINTVLSGTMYNLRSVKTDYAYREILYLIKYKSDEFEFDSFAPEYFYFKNDYNTFRKIEKAVNRSVEVTESPLVTVVLPCLNSKEYIRECVESILEQTLTNIEILVVDAGSTDGTVDILKQYTEKDPRISIIHSDKKSYGYQLNLGLRAAKGKYFAIVESDDYIKPEMYEELTQIAEEHELEVVKTDYRIFYGNHKNRTYSNRAVLPIKTLYNQVIDPEKDHRIFKNYVVSWSSIYRTDFLRNNSIYHHESAGASFQDNGFWFQVFTQAHRVMFHNKPYYMLRRDNPGSSVFNPAKAYCMVYEYDFIRNFLRNNPELEEKYTGLCTFKRFKNCTWANENLVTEENRAEYIEKISDDFKELFCKGEVEQKYFSKDEYREFLAIAFFPEEYCFQYQPKTYDYRFIGPISLIDYYRSELHSANLKLKSANLKLKQEQEISRKRYREIVEKNNIINSQQLTLHNFEVSKSYRIGRVITFSPRKLKATIHYYRNNGLRATFKKIVTSILQKRGN